MSDTLPESGVRDLLLWLFRRRRRYRVTNVSMLPLLQPGDEVLLDPQAYKRAFPQAGDIVVAHHPSESSLIIKRVISVTADGRCYLQGDNAAESTDSRAFGAVAVDDILGRVVCYFA